jgi:hypothetical protein
MQRVAAVAINRVNPLSQQIPIVDDTGRPTLEFMLKWNKQQAQQNARTITDVEIAFTDNTVGNASTAKHGYLRKLSGVVSQFLAGDGVFRTIPYDLCAYLPTVTGPAGSVCKFVSARAFLITMSTCKGHATTAPAGGSVTFTLNKNGSAIGTIVFADGATTSTASGAGGGFVAGDVLTIDVTADHGIAFVALTVTGVAS